MITPRIRKKREGGQLSGLCAGSNENGGTTKRKAVRYSLLILALAGALLLIQTTALNQAKFSTATNKTAAMEEEETEMEVQTETMEMEEQQTEQKKLRQWTKWKKMLPCMKSWAVSSKRKYHSEVLTACSSEWAYVHVLKSGGTTVQQQCQDPQGDKTSDYYKTHKLFTFVRDPISHFLSGYMECAHRREPRSFKFIVGGREMNENIKLWLSRNSPDKGYHWCFQHCAPQIEYLLFHINGRSDPLRFLDRFRYIGDKEEMEDFFWENRLPWHETNVRNRVSDSPIKKRMKEGLRIENLDDSTLMEICDLVKIDYCWFDYEPPPVCRDMIDSFCNGVCVTTNNNGATTNRTKQQN